MKAGSYFIRIIAGVLASAFCAFALLSCVYRQTDILGDCNGDGKVNSIDSNYICRSILGEKILLLEENADLNEDGLKNEADKNLLKEYLAGTFLPGDRFSDIYINGMDIEKYAVVYPADHTDFEKWTAELLVTSLKDLCGAELSLRPDSEKEQQYEFLIGNTNRKESQDWDADAEKFLIFSRSGKIILKGENYLVAGGVGYINSLLENSKSEWNTQTELNIPKEIKSRPVKWQDPDRIFLFIGDGMGLNHTKMSTDEKATVEYAEGIISAPDEKGFDTFWPSTFTNIGSAVTLNIQNSTTDSAAAATALSTGCKTLNGALGMIPCDLDGDGEENEYRSVQNVREAAALKGKATAVLSTDRQTGATPNGFLVHHSSRKDKDIILKQQTALDMSRLACNYLWCSYDSDDLFSEFCDALDTCDDNPGGFFIMTEEAMIDKYSEKMDYDNAIRTVKRLNKVTAYTSVYAMCHWDSLVILTADHETGGLTPGEDNVWRWTSDGEHTSLNVPVFAMGSGTEYFNGTTCQNTDIAKFLFEAVD